jgi:hypothetical protein
MDTYQYCSKIAVRQSVISKKSSAVIIIIAIIRIVIAFSQFVNVLL